MNSKRHTFVLWPPLTELERNERNQWLATVSWFAGHLADDILIPGVALQGELGRPPKFVSITSLIDAEKVRFTTVGQAEARIKQGDVTILVRRQDISDCVPNLNAVKVPGSQPVLGIGDASNEGVSSPHYYYIGSPDIEVQDAYYAVCLTYWLTGGEDRDLLTESQRQLKQIKTTASKLERVSIFGTGPSLSEALDRDYSRSLNIICNTIVKNRSFCSNLAPKIIVASDAHFHFSYHRYAVRFLSDLACLLEHNSDAVFFTFDKFAVFARRRLPFISDRIFGIPAGRNSYGFDFDIDYRIFPGDSVLNMFLLPLASFLGDEVSLNGFTGRSPTDSYFWNHSDLHQYTDLMEDVRLAHPAFFRNRDYGGYADTVDREIKLRVDFARSNGKMISSETTTFYSAFNS